MKKIKFILPVLAVTLFSCSDYLDQGENDPNKPLISQVTPDLLLPAAEVGAFRNQASTMNQLGNVFANSWGSNVQSYTGGYSREYQLTIDNAFYTGIWDNTYLNVNNFQQILKVADPNGDKYGKYAYYKAAAKIMKAHYMQYIVDLYGDAPYTDAFKGLDVRTPKYNDDQFIYRQLLNELDEARDLINNATVDAADISAADVVLQGDMSKWYDFANTIELRMLLRMSNNTGAVATYRDTRLAALSGQSFVSTDVTINPGYSANNDDQLNPFYAANYTDAAGTATQNRTFICPSGHIYKALNTNANWNTGAAPEIITGSGIYYPNVADPRRTRIFTNGASQAYMRAVTQGSNVVDVFPVGGAAGLPGRLGTGLFNPHNAIAAAVVTDYAYANGYVMTLMESEFLQAEAALRYPAWFGGASAHFNAGVTASFSHLSSTIGTYLTTINTKPNFGFNVANTFNQNLHAIMYQKWIALSGIHGIETFIDYNRTGYPLTPLATTATQTRKPRRLIYPLSEYVANSVNVPNITPAQIFATTDNSHPFWMLGDPALGN